VSIYNGFVGQIDCSLLCLLYKMTEELTLEIFFSNLPYSLPASWLCGNNSALGHILGASRAGGCGPWVSTRVRPLHAALRPCVWVCVCVRERERERERERVMCFDTCSSTSHRTKTMCMRIRVSVCTCVCARERERESCVFRHVFVHFAPR